MLETAYYKPLNQTMRSNIAKNALLRNRKLFKIKVSRSNVKTTSITICIIPKHKWKDSNLNQRKYCLNRKLQF